MGPRPHAPWDPTLTPHGTPPQVFLDAGLAANFNERIYGSVTVFFESSARREALF